MDRVAVFVDAGYVFAAGSILVTGEKLTRGAINLDHAAAVKELSAFATMVSGLPLLRIYRNIGWLRRSRQIFRGVLSLCKPSQKLWPPRSHRTNLRRLLQPRASINCLVTLTGCFLSALLGRSGQS